MNGCEHEKNGHCTLNECMYGDFLFIDDSAFESGRYCMCDDVQKLKDKRMTPEEIKARIEQLKQEIFYEEMKDKGWSYSYISTRQVEIKKLEAMLNQEGTEDDKG